MNNPIDIPSMVINIECTSYREKRIDGPENLTALYKDLWGKIQLDRFERLNPLVQVVGDADLLTFDYISYAGETESRWNCTEVYRRNGEQWQITQTH